MNKGRELLIPVAIVIAAIVLSGAIYIVRSGHQTATPELVQATLRPVSAADHILGNPNAPVTVVEYADMDCSYCRTFAESMMQLMTNYGASGKVAWVYRHFPVIDTHPYAAEHAEAAECVAAQGSNTLFFRFIDALMQSTPSGVDADPRSYENIVKSLGLSVPAFTTCLTNGTYASRVTDDYNNAIGAGAEGSPYIVLLVKGGKPIPVSGALPYDALKKVLDAALAKVPQ